LLTKRNALEKSAKTNRREITLPCRDQFPSLTNSFLTCRFPILIKNPTRSLSVGDVTFVVGGLLSYIWFGRRIIPEAPRIVCGKGAGDLFAALAPRRHAHTRPHPQSVTETPHLYYPLGLTDPVPQRVHLRSLPSTIQEWAAFHLSGGLSLSSDARAVEAAAREPG